MIYDDRVCELGEGAFWHPVRQEFFWFDIIGQKLMTKDHTWTFDTYASAAGWIDDDRLLTIDMTLTAPGCGMGDILVEDVRSKVMLVPTVGDADVELVFDL